MLGGYKNMSTFIPHTKAELREKQRYGDLIHKAQEKDVYKTIKTFMRLNKIKNVLDKIQVS